MPKSIEEKAIKLFNLIDSDKSKSISRQETINFWAKNFAKLNSNELFRNVDKNNDNDIEISEWIEFWTKVFENYNEDIVNVEVIF